MQDLRSSALYSPRFAFFLFCQCLCTGVPVGSYTTCSCLVTRDHTQITNNMESGSQWITKRGCNFLFQIALLLMFASLLLSSVPTRAPSSKPPKVILKPPDHWNQQKTVMIVSIACCSIILVLFFFIFIMCYKNNQRHTRNVGLDKYPIKSQLTRQVCRKPSSKMSRFQ